MFKDLSQRAGSDSLAHGVSPFPGADTFDEPFRPGDGHVTDRSVKAFLPASVGRLKVDVPRSVTVEADLEEPIRPARMREVMNPLGGFWCRSASLV